MYAINERYLNNYKNFESLQFYVRFEHLYRGLATHITEFLDISYMGTFKSKMQNDTKNWQLRITVVIVIEAKLKKK